MAANQRKVTNYIKNARLQKRYHMMALGCLFVVGVMVVYAVRVLKDALQTLVDIPESAGVNLQPVYDAVIQASGMFFGCFILFSMFAVFFIMVIEQRVGGASIAILKVIEEMKKGNYTYKRNLRTNDELKNIMQGLQELAEILEEKNKNK